MIEQAPTRITKTKNVNTSESSVQRGSGNIFGDLDLPDADFHLLKAELVSRFDDIVRQRRMTQAELVRTLGLCSSDRGGTLRPFVWAPDSNFFHRPDVACGA